MSIVASDNSEKEAGFTDKFITLESTKVKNLCDILEYILECGKTNRREISESTGFGWGTVSAYVKELLEKGYITESEGEKSASAGRRVSFLYPNANAVCIGLDINRTGLAGEAVGLDGIRKERITRPFTGKTQSAVIENMLSLCRDVISLCKSKYRVISIGAAFQGTVDEKEGASLAFPKIADWPPVCIRDILEKEFALPSWLGHDPICMLLSEAYRKKFRDLILIRADKGIGMAVMQNGSVCFDSGKFELGHIRIDKLTLEEYSSLDGIAARIGKGFEAAAEEYRRSGAYREIFDEAAEKLGDALCNTAILFSPERIILTGQITEYGDILCDKIAEYYRKEYTDRGGKTELCIKKELSAASGAAVESLKNAIRHGKIRKE